MLGPAINLKNVADVTKRGWSAPTCPQGETKLETTCILHAGSWIFHQNYEEHAVGPSLSDIMISCEIQHRA